MASPAPFLREILQLWNGSKPVPWKCDDSGAAAVSVKNADFTPSSYDHTLTMDDSAQVEPLATGTTKVKVGNLGATGEPIRVAFGASEQNAEDNLTVDTGAATTGHYIPAIADAGSEAFQVLGVPALATHFAVCNAVASDTQVVVVTQGV